MILFQHRYHKVRSCNVDIVEGGLFVIEGGISTDIRYLRSCVSIGITTDIGRVRRQGSCQQLLPEK